MTVGRTDPTKGHIPAILSFAECLAKHPSETFWFFVQFAKDDLDANLQYFILKLMIEHRPEVNRIY